MTRDPFGLGDVAAKDLWRQRRAEQRSAQSRIADGFDQVFKFIGQPIRLLITAVETQRQHAPAHRQSERRLVADGGGEDAKFVECGIVMADSRPKRAGEQQRA